jgi:hypothetical protein
MHGWEYHEVEFDGAISLLIIILKLGYILKIQ